jgi:PAS domain S-box-containing protein
LDRVWTICVDRSNKVWFSERSRGVGTVDERDGLVFYTTKDGLAGNEVWEIAPDPDGSLWISSVGGISHFQNGIWSTFNKRTGLANTFLWPIARKDSVLYAGTIGNGLAILDLGESALPPPRIYLDIPVITGETAYYRWHAFPFRCQEPAEEVQVRYRVDNQEWSAWSNSREHAFANLSPGNHAFEIQSKSMFGTVSHQPVIASFSVPSPFYELPVFFIPIGALSLFVIALSLNQVRRRRMHSTEILASEAKFRRLTEAAFEGILIHDQGRIIDSNKRLCLLLGCEPSACAGKQVADFATEDNRGALREITEQGTEIETPLEISFRRTDGRELITEILAKRISSDGRSVGVLIIRDITERKAAEHKLLDYQEQLRSLTAELTMSEERERRQMAVTLHDSIGHALALCKIKLGQLDVNGAEEGMKEVKNLLEEAIHNTRSLTFELSPPVIHNLHFEDAIEWLVEHFGEQYNLLVSFEHDGDPVVLSEQLRSFLYNSVRELLVNIVKHSGAKSADVVLSHANGMVELSVHDDGHGFEADAAPPPGAARHGFGLFSIRERMSLYCGSMDVQSSAGEGTTVALKMRVPAREG